MSLSFNLKSEVMDIYDTEDGGEEPIHPAKVMMIDWDGENVVYVLVPLDVFEPYKDAVQAGTFVSIVGELREVPGRKWHVATSMRIAGRKH